MRKVLILLLLLLPALVQAKDKKKPPPKHFVPGGRWVEVQRLSLDSQQVAFSDTLFMSFQIKDSFSYRVRNGFVYRGKYTIDDEGHVDFGTKSYELALRKPNSLIFTDTKGIYYYVPDTSAEQITVLEKEEKILPVTNIDQMIGHWTVYKKVEGKDGSSTDFNSQIKSAYITGLSSDNNQGVLYCGNDADDNPSWVIKAFTPDQQLECAGKSQRFLRIVKCQKGELILEEAGMSYYFKQFK